jgi:hypothetical protein
MAKHRRNLPWIFLPAMQRLGFGRGFGQRSRWPRLSTVQRQMTERPPPLPKKPSANRPSGKVNGFVAGSRSENCQKPGILVYEVFGHEPQNNSNILPHDFAESSRWQLACKTPRFQNWNSDCHELA